MDHWQPCHLAGRWNSLGPVRAQPHLPLTGDLGLCPILGFQAFCQSKQQSCPRIKSQEFKRSSATHRTERWRAGVQGDNSLSDIYSPPSPRRLPRPCWLLAGAHGEASWAACWGRGCPATQAEHRLVCGCRHLYLVLVFVSWASRWGWAALSGFGHLLFILCCCLSFLLLAPGKAVVMDKALCLAYRAVCRKRVVTRNAPRGFRAKVTISPCLVFMPKCSHRIKQGEQLQNMPPPQKPYPPLPPPQSQSSSTALYLGLQIPLQETEERVKEESE